MLFSLPNPLEFDHAKLQVTCNEKIWSNYNLSMKKRYLSGNLGNIGKLKEKNKHRIKNIIKIILVVFKGS